ncbi:CKLF-like MARVEL transmembrane domain-containing protein 6 isoform X2 [Pipistrellus kuhlii]|uniref:CKLF-like MARVEL transmembrane domain-containing protein 6 isoform X2 n=1 Tax=Pipistrellus kuhlii TaxID=59472 RepID=UPI00174F5F02|nr:CKLF-like MARVEL transmembrane domain-containing protein 6 isoform X2 [Pipistrellus kuhlii]
MENGAVYRPTTEEDPGPARGARSGLAAYCNLGRLPLTQRVLKGLQLLLSLLAFICEEVVSQCTLCGGLYFFEFVSSSAFLLCLLLLIVYCTPVYERVDAGKVKSSGFGFLASFMFVGDFVFMMVEKRRESQMRKPEPDRAEPLTEPLNA